MAQPQQRPPLTEEEQNAKVAEFIARDFVPIPTLTPDTQAACKRALGIFIYKLPRFPREPVAAAAAAAANGPAAAAANPPPPSKRLIFQRWLLKYNFVFIHWIRMQVNAGKLTPRTFEIVSNYMAGLRAEARRQALARIEAAAAAGNPAGAGSMGGGRRRHHAKTGRNRSKVRKGTRKYYGGKTETVILEDELYEEWQNEPTELIELEEEVYKPITSESKLNNSKNTRENISADIMNL